MSALHPLTGFSLDTTPQPDAVSADITFDPAGHLDVDLPCIACGYNLRGLPRDGNCPECDRSIDNSINYGSLILRSEWVARMTAAIALLTIWPAIRFLTWVLPPFFQLQLWPTPIIRVIEVVVAAAVCFIVFNCLPLAPMMTVGNAVTAKFATRRQWLRVCLAGLVVGLVLQLTSQIAVMTTNPTSSALGYARWLIPILSLVAGSMSVCFLTALTFYITEGIRIAVSKRLVFVVNIAAVSVATMLFTTYIFWGWYVASMPSGHVPYGFTFASMLLGGVGGFASWLIHAVLLRHLSRAWFSLREKRNLQTEPSVIATTSDRAV